MEEVFKNKNERKDLTNVLELQERGDLFRNIIGKLRYNSQSGGCNFGFLCSHALIIFCFHMH